MFHVEQTPRRSCGITLKGRGMDWKHWGGVPRDKQEALLLELEQLCPEPEYNPGQAHEVTAFALGKRNVVNNMRACLKSERDNQNEIQAGEPERREY